MILVVGSTGSLGGRITRQLLNQSKSVRILVRSSSDYQPLLDAGAQPMIGDLKDRASLDKACEGVTTVITTANSAQRSGEDNVENVDLKGNRSLIDAATAAGVRHFIFTSVLGVSEDSPVPFVRAKAKTEAHLRDSGMNYTILAPNIFMDVWFGIVIGLPVQNNHPIALVGEADKKHTFVAAQDVAAFGVAAVDNPAAINQYIAIGGPEAVSWQDVVAIAGRVLGRELQIRRISPDEPIPFVPPHVGMAMSGLMAYSNTYETRIDMTETARTFGVRLTSVEDFLRQMFAVPVD